MFLSYAIPSVAINVFPNSVYKQLRVRLIDLYTLFFLRLCNWCGPILLNLEGHLRWTCSLRCYAQHHSINSNHNVFAKALLTFQCYRRNNGYGNLKTNNWNVVWWIWILMICNVIGLQTHRMYIIRTCSKPLDNWWIPNRKRSFTRITVTLCVF